MRVRVDLRANCTFEEAANGTWKAYFPYLDISGAGTTEDEAFQNLAKSLQEKVSASEELAGKWQKFIKEYGVEEEVPGEELRKRRELIDRSHAASAGFRTLNADTFDAAIASERPVLVDFWAEWCMPCHMMAPVLKEVAGELGGRIEIAKLNVDENPDFWKRLSIEGIPTLILFSSGKERRRIVGAGRSKEQILEELEPHLV